MGEKIRRAQTIVDDVKYTARDLFTVANLTGSLKIDGHRADLVILKTARAHAAFEGRLQINERDILLATELAIPHRLKRGPFQDIRMSMSELEERVEQISTDWKGEESEAGPLRGRNAY